MVISAVLVRTRVLYASRTVNAATHGSVGPGEGCCLSLLSLYNWYQLVLRYKLYCMQVWCKLVQATYRTAVGTVVQRQQRQAAALPWPDGAVHGGR